MEILATQLLFLIRDDIKVDLRNVLDYYNVKKSAKDKIIETINDAEDNLVPYQ